MKLSVAAAAIAFSGTALIFAPTAASAAPTQAKAQTSVKSGLDLGEVEKAGITGAGFAKDGMDSKAGVSTAKLETGSYQGMGGASEEASIDGQGGGAKLAGTRSGKEGVGDAGAKVLNASMDTGAKAWSTDGGEGKLALADMGGGEGKLAMSGKTGLDAGSQFASKQAGNRDSNQPVETTAVAKEAVAPGAALGQVKEVHTGMGGPEEAITEYRACRPGRGDDRCIQLYEVGGSAKA